VRKRGRGGRRFLGEIAVRQVKQSALKVKKTRMKRILLVQKGQIFCWLGGSKKREARGQFSGKETSEGRGGKLGKTGG